MDYQRLQVKLITTKDMFHRHTRYVYVHLSVSDFAIIDTETSIAIFLHVPQYPNNNQRERSDMLEVDAWDLDRILLPSSQKIKVSSYIQRSMLKAANKIFSIVCGFITHVL